VFLPAKERRSVVGVVTARALEDARSVVGACVSTWICASSQSTNSPSSQIVSTSISSNPMIGSVASHRTKCSRFCLRIRSIGQLRVISLIAGGAPGSKRWGLPTAFENLAPLEVGEAVSVRPRRRAHRRGEGSASFCRRASADETAGTAGERSAVGQGDPEFLLALGEQVRRGFEQVNVAGDPEPVANSVFGCSGSVAERPDGQRRAIVVGDPGIGVPVVDRQ